MGKRKEKKVRLFIFEPYEWMYCGGVIGVIAHSFEQAVEVILKESKLRDEHKKEHFSRKKESFVEGTYNQWLLTHEIEVIGHGPKLLFENWNYA